MAGSEMIRIDAFTVARSMPSVVLDSTDHLYRAAYAAVYGRGPAFMHGLPSGRSTATARMSGRGGADHALTA